MKTILLFLTILTTLSAGCVSKPHTVGVRPRNATLDQTLAAETEPSRKVIPTQVFSITTPFTIVIEDPMTLRERIQRELGFTNGVALFNKKTRTLYVPYAKEGSLEEFDFWDRRMPSLESLGHELWHLPELGGWWHFQPPTELKNNSAPR
ncbi:MAG: hypothetical protein Q7S86_02405 [bacterium]|nr:hypothetical protein [bacterium]